LLVKRSVDFDRIPDQKPFATQMQPRNSGKGTYIHRYSSGISRKEPEICGKSRVMKLSRFQIIFPNSLKADFPLRFTRLFWVFVINEDFARKLLNCGINSGFRFRSVLAKNLHSVVSKRGEQNYILNQTFTNVADKIYGFIGFDTFGKKLKITDRLLNNLPAGYQRQGHFIGATCKAGCWHTKTSRQLTR
jgi:hypothetical protein